MRHERAPARGSPCTGQIPKSAVTQQNNDVRRPEGEGGTLNPEAAHFPQQWITTTDAAPIASQRAATGSSLQYRWYAQPSSCHLNQGVIAWGFPFVDCKHSIATPHRAPTVRHNDPTAEPCVQHTCAAASSSSGSHGAPRPTSSPAPCPTAFTAYVLFSFSATFSHTKGAAHPRGCAQHTRAAEPNAPSATPRSAPAMQAL
jgi:hypothetical protein